MKLIQNNPYRIVGLLAGSTAKEQERQVRRLKQFIKTENDPEEDFSFPILGLLNRTLSSIEEAASKLNLDSDKINAALFWFWNGNPITDEVAFDALKSGDIDTAIEIWRKLTEDAEEVTKRNASAFHNLSTLYLSEYDIDKDTLNLKLRFLESDYIHSLAQSVTDSTFKISEKDLQLLFLNGITQGGQFEMSTILDAISDIEFVAKQDFLKRFIQRLITQIERQIETTKNKRKANKANAANVGSELYNATTKELAELESILGTNDIRYTSITDKVADEILQCGIDYFKHYRDTNIDPGNTSLDLFQKAKILAVGSIATQRIQENTQNLQEWIDNRAERDKQKRIADDFGKLKDLIDRYEGLAKTVANAKQLLLSARPYLNNVRSILGNTDELYLGLSSRIGSDAQGMCVSEINKLQERFANTYDNATKRSVILLLKQQVDEAWQVVNTISAMDLRSDFRSRVNQNKNSLSNLKNQLSQVNSVSNVSNGGESNWAEDNPGCLIVLIIVVIFFLISIFSK